MHKYIKFILLLFFAASYGGSLISAQNTSARAKEKVLGYNRDNKFVNFAYITDIHINGKNDEVYCAKPNLQHFVAMCNEGFCDFAVFGGDAHTAYGTTRDEAFGYISEVSEYFNSISIPLYTTKGNHDRNAKITQEETISNVEYHMLFHNHLDTNVVRFNPNDPYGNYFYADYPMEKVRIINLNYYDSEYMQEPGIHDKQLMWLDEIALDFSNYENPSDWTVVLFAHYYKHCGERFWKIIQEKREKTGAKVAALIYGDSHFDQFSFEHGMNMVGVMCGYCTPEQVGTPSEDSFSIFTVDTLNECLIETKVGRGEDRRFHFH